MCKVAPIMSRRAQFAAWLLSALATSLLFPAVCAAQKPETWIEVRSPNFTVISNAGERRARQLAEEFELFRAVVQTVMNKVKVDPGQPFLILAVKGEKDLKRLLPAYWEVKGRVHPAGYFVPGPEKHYAALRMDASGEHPYHVVYHEYVHLLVRVNFPWIPLWLNEGLAEFYASANFTGMQVGVGKPMEYHLYLLNERKMLPIVELLSVDHSSPHYNEANRASVFYGQSWALTHYLLLGDQMAHSKQLGQYLDALDKGLSQQEAAAQAFGDLKKFEKTLDNYLGLQNFYYIPIKPPKDIDAKQFVSRALTPAEAAAVAGDFYVHTRRPAEARAELEQAMKLDPSLAAPRESLGMLAFHEGNRDEALRWFAEAIERDSKSFLAHYFHSMLSFQGHVSSDQLQAAEAGLRRATELRPNFAPAHATLALLYAMKDEQLEQALEHARRAAQLDPGTMTHHLGVANILLRLGRADEARALAQRVLAAAKQPGDRFAAQNFLENIDRRVAYEAEKKKFEEERRKVQEELQREVAGRKVQEQDKQESPPIQPASPAVTKPAASPALGPLAPGEGVVTAVTCNGPKLDLTLTLAGLDIKLHSENFYKVEYLTTRWKAPGNFNPCQHLKGRQVQVEYRLVMDRPYSGELVSIEVRK